MKKKLLWDGEKWGSPYGGCQEDSFRKTHFAETWVTGGSQFAQKAEGQRQSKDRGRKEPDMLEEENTVWQQAVWGETEQGQYLPSPHSQVGSHRQLCAEEKTSLIYIWKRSIQSTVTKMKAGLLNLNWALSNTQKWIFWGDTHMLRKQEILLGRGYSGRERRGQENRERVAVPRRGLGEGRGTQENAALLYVAAWLGS